MHSFNVCVTGSDYPTNSGCFLVCSLSVQALTNECDIHSINQSHKWVNRYAAGWDMVTRYCDARASYDKSNENDDTGITFSRGHLFQNFREKICLRTCWASELLSLTLVSSCETIDCRSSCNGTRRPGETPSVVSTIWKQSELVASGRTRSLEFSLQRYLCGQYRPTRERNTPTDFLAVILLPQMRIVEIVCQAIFASHQHYIIILRNCAVVF